MPNSPSGPVTMFQRILLSLLVLTGSALSLQADYPLEPKLLLRYDFSPGSVKGNQVADTSGNKYNGTVSGRAKIGPMPDTRHNGLDNTASQMGSAANGSGGSIRYSGQGPGKLKSFTVALWYRVDNQKITQGTRLFDFSGIGQPILLGFDSDKGHLAFNEGSKRLMRNNTARAVLNAENEWAFVAVVFDGTTTRDNLRLFAYFGDRTIAGVYGKGGSAGKNAGNLLPVEVVHPIAAVSLDRREWDFSGNVVNLVFAANPANGRALSGYVADILVYGSADDESGALDHVQLMELVSRTHPDGRSSR